ncbi:MAG TPA: DUF6438 domain-containing protein [Longimicrobiales bacterium]|nr:DUF6438 domain-containing protein [Longimicrobiales bacterium]
MPALTFIHISVALPIVAGALVGCSPNPEVRPAPSSGSQHTAADSLVLERTVCFGRCPAYRLRIGSAGFVLFEPRIPPGPAAADTIPNTALPHLAAEAERVGFYAFPDLIQGDSALCAMEATDHPSATITIHRGSEFKRVQDYTGCHAASGDTVSAQRLRGLRQFQALVDSVAGSARWTAREP